MELTDTFGGGAPYPVLAGNQRLIIVAVKLMTCINETCQENFQMALTEAKLFKLDMKQLSFFLFDSYGKAHDCFTP